MPPAEPGPLAIVLSGGGARAAYQVGLLRCLARYRPDLRFEIITGVSAGAINAVYLAAHPGGLPEAALGLAELWGHLTVEKVFDTRSLALFSKVTGWSGRLLGGGRPSAGPARGMVSTRPLGELLERALNTRDGEIVGIADNLARERLRAFALTTLDYGTGRTITWVQGHQIEGWERPHRRSQAAQITVPHVMASAALPLFFPAIRLGDSWHGDGGVRLSAPLSPAVHLGATRILVISTRYRRSFEEAATPSVQGYPPPAQILGHLVNAIFLDVIDQDILRLERINALLTQVPPERRLGMRPIRILALRPSRDLGRLSSEHEAQLPRMFRFLTRGLGTRETQSPDFLSLLMFQPSYLRQLMEIGEADAEARRDEIAELVDGQP
jgi:NTE family protein